jgi:glycosyltransferase involved in cell wall biosynthesis
MSGLVLALDIPLPTSLPIGVGTAIFCCGSCFHRDERIAALELVVGRRDRYESGAFGMPRADVAAAVGAAGYLSGFWATVPVQPREQPGSVEIAVAAQLDGGEELVASVGAIDVVEPTPAPFAPSLEAPATALIAVCMATFEPDMALFRAQIESLRAQTDDRWICVISDDCSSPELYRELITVVGDDPRFAVSRSPSHLGFYGNFERALRAAPAGAELLALCDQDDRWQPEKLATLRAELGDAGLVYCDQRLVDASGRVLGETMWEGRRNNHTNLTSLLVANSITGASTLFRREIAELALPFPEPPGFRFHDHWLALVALAAGDVAYVDRPLYDYVQHAGAVFGDVAVGSGPRRRRVREVLLSWRAAYYYGFLSRAVQAQALLMRCGERLTPDKRRAMERFARADRSPASFAWLALRPLRRLAGRSETLGTELDLVQGILWRWLVRFLVGRFPSRRGSLLDASPPPPGSFSQRRLRRWRARIGRV